MIRPLTAFAALALLTACGTTTDDAPKGSGNDGGPVAAADGGADAGGFPSSDAGQFETDGGASPDAAACTKLAIGIFGNPGANPSSNFQTWLEKSGTSVKRVLTAPADRLTADVLAPFDVVVLDWLTRDFDATEKDAFATWVAAGGGVVSMSGYSNDTVSDWHANSLLAPLGVAYVGSIMNGPVTTFVSHPITTGLTSVTFEGGYAIQNLGGPATRTTIAKLGTSDVGYAIESGKGRAFVWGDEWIEFDSEWSTLPEIQQLWVQAFAWIAPHDKCKLTPPIH